MWVTREKLKLLIEFIRKYSKSDPPPNIPISGGWNLEINPPRLTAPDHNIQWDVRNIYTKDGYLHVYGRVSILICFKLVIKPTEESDPFTFTLDFFIGIGMNYRFSSGILPRDPLATSDSKVLKLNCPICKPASRRCSQCLTWPGYTNQSECEYHGRLDIAYCPSCIQEKNKSNKLKAD